jgi:hypothetical protein
MADIRINALATTAASTASDDFVAVDGSANGTRKLNAYSPTFGGNLTVSGTGNSSVAGNFGIGETSPVVPLHAKTSGTSTAVYGNVIGTFRSTAAGRDISLQFSDGTNQTYISSNAGALYLGTGGATTGLTLDASRNTTLAGNLTVSGGTITSGSGTLTLNSSANTVVLQSAGTTALTLDSSQNATFGGTSVTVDGASTGSTLTLKRASNANGAIISYKTTTTSKWYHGLRGLVDDNWYLQNDVAGNTALFFDASTSNATFAGQITASGISHKLGSGGTGSANALLTIDGSSASSYGPYIVLQRNSTNKWQFGTYSGINGGTSDDFLLYNPTAANEALKIAAATSNATFAGSIAIGNTVNTVSPTSPNRTITMVIGGTTYYIHAKTTND